jgi:hypothetical protein
MTLPAHELVQARRELVEIRRQRHIEVAGGSLERKLELQCRRSNEDERAVAPQSCELLERALLCSRQGHLSPLSGSGRGAA